MGKSKTPSKKPAAAAVAAARRGNNKKKASPSFSNPAMIGCLVVAVFSFVLMKFSPTSTDERRLSSVVQHTFPCDDEALSHFLQEDAVPGYHVACVYDANDDNSTAAWKAEIYAGGQNLDSKKTVDLNVVLSPANEMRWDVLQTSLKDSLNLRTTDRLHQPWALFTPNGERIVEEDQSLSETENGHVMQRILDSRMIIIYEGGMWVWPGVRIGYKRKVDLFPIEPGARQTPNMKEAIIETLSLRPLVFSVEGFLSEGECDHIQEQATPRLEYSKVLQNDKIARENTKDAYHRTSQQASLLAARDVTLMLISDRTASLVRAPRNNQEKLQVLRYGLGEKYDAHTDAMRPDAYKDNPVVLEKLAYGRKNRFATVFWYMSNVAEGGETIFPRWNGAPYPENLSDCSTGLKVKPEKGKVIIFYNLLPDGNIDDISLHGACPVRDGVKWAANKWIWNSAF